MFFPRGYQVLILFAVIPAIFLMRKVYLKDYAEKESPTLLLSLVGCGILATFLAMITESAGETFLGFLPIRRFSTYRFWYYFGVVAVSEEFFKYIFMKWRTWKNPGFNYQFDGIVYAVFISLGFALWENILYTFNYGLGTALVRAVTSIPGHACFGVFMGFWYGLAKKAENYGDYGKSKIYRILSLVCPILLHGLYDYAATSSNDITLFFLGFIVILFVISYRIVNHVSENDDTIC